MSEASKKRHQTMVTKAKLQALRAGAAYLDVHPAGSWDAYEQLGREQADLLYSHNRTLYHIYLDTWKKAAKLRDKSKHPFSEERQAQLNFLLVIQARIHQERVPREKAPGADTSTGDRTLF